ncbi:Glycerol metabolism activator [Sphingomonas aurantiaca]|uniref:Glycerol metabolism activator n=1 Tax=Sphingomonas aurantiaca TaxID=185949 RepID=A0A5E8AGU0_9SPHN|nr:MULTISPECIES: response regulator transcription factor [Sphingomonas]MBD8472277.1 response regulator transcription factor [Sphingomonas sp. CFBP 8765]VVT28189.1 Glycerol metabolism activator [Sphingomonas aurantiaca]
MSQAASHSLSRAEPVHQPRAGGHDVERVLIADDHPLVRDGLRTVISVAFDQCELFEASSIAEAIAIVEREGDFDLVLLDLNMPDAEGFSGLAQMRDRFPSVPVVIVSGACEGGLISASIANGAAGFIPKSLKRSAIVEAIQSILAGDVFMPEEFRTIGADNVALDDIRRRVETLTPQQRVVLGLVVGGKLNKQIAFELDVSMTTVKAHVSAILAKLNVYSRTQAVILANKINFVPAPLAARH